MSKLSREDLLKLLELLGEAYKESGREIKTAVLYDEEDVEILVDNREEEDIN